MTLQQLYSYKCLFTINGVNLKKVENLKYLGRKICDTDLNSPALFMNLCTARKLRRRLFCLIARKGADPVVGGKIYVAAVIQYCCTDQKPWCGTSVCSTAYKAFIIMLVGGLLTSKKPKLLQNGTYEYCKADEAMRDCNKLLLPIQVYIAWRRQNVYTYIEKKLIYAFCKTTKSSAGTPTGMCFDGSRIYHIGKI